MVIELERVTSSRQFDAIISLILRATREEVPFTVEQFCHWALRSLDDPNVLVFVGRVDGKAAGFCICFGPWELDRDVFVFQAYAAPGFRCTNLLQKGIKYIKTWARSVGAEGLNFETPRPRAWNRLLNKKSTKTKVHVEV